MRHSKIKLYNSKGFSLEKRVIPFLVPKFGFFLKGRLITVTSVPLDRPLLIIFGGITIFIVDASSFSIEIFWSKYDQIWSHLLKKLLIFCIVKFLVTLRLNNLNTGYNHIRSSGDRKQLKKTSLSLKSFSEIFTDVSFPTSGIFFENMNCWFNEWLHIINHRSSLIDHER